MKAKRRQELKTNELAQTLTQAREFMGKYGNYVIGGVVVVAVILSASVWYRRSLSDAHRRQWADYYALRQADAQFITTPEGTNFEALLTRHKDLASSTSNSAVRLRTLEGLGTLCWSYAVLSDPAPDAEEGSRALDEATSSYESIVRDFSDDEQAAGNALLALAAIAEERGEFDQAVTYYGRIDVEAKFADSVFVALARDRLSSMDALRETIVFAPAPPPPEETADTPDAELPAGTVEIPLTPVDPPDWAVRQAMQQLADGNTGRVESSNENAGDAAPAVDEESSEEAGDPEESSAGEAETDNSEETVTEPEGSDPGETETQDESDESSSAESGGGESSGG